MKTIPYDALIEDARVTPGEIARRRDAARLAEIARNLESLAQLARAEASATAPGAGSTDTQTKASAVSGAAHEENR
jgi:hypothetical protein